MSDRDTELDDLLSPLRGTEPSEMELRSWQRAVSAEVSRWRRARPALFWAGQLAAALLIGFFVGRWGFSSSGTNGETFPNATIEYISVKS